MKTRPTRHQQREAERTARRSLGALQRAQGVTGAAQDLAESFSSGGNPVTATARFLGTVTKEFKGLLGTKFVKIAAVQTAKILGQDKRFAASMLSGMRGGLKMATPVIGAVAMGLDIGSRIGLGLFDATAKRNAAKGTSFDLARKNGINVGSFGLKSRQIDQNVAAMQGPFDRLMNALGFDEGQTEEQDRQKAALAENTVRARGALSPNARQAAVAKYAKRKGVAAHLLTPGEIAEAQDEANENLLNSKLHQADARVDTELALLSPIEQDDYYRGDGEKQSAIRQKIYFDKVLPKIFSRSFAENQKLRDEIAEKQERARSGAERQQRKMQEEQADATFRSHLSRHKAWSND
jgi:hypothetical protein